MNGRIRRSIFLVLLGATLAPAALHAGDGPCGGLGERACCCFGDGRTCPFDPPCDDGFFEVLLPGCGDAGSSTPSCGGCSIGWCAKSTSCGSEGKRACCGPPACEGDLIQDFTRDGECHEVRDPERCVCGGGVFLSSGVCVPPKQVGERCNLLTPCADGLECQILDATEARCYPGRDEGGIDDDICIRLYDREKHDEAIESGQTLTFGAGASIAAGVSFGFESGVVYGRDGFFGCYLSTCDGFVTDVSAGYSLSQAQLNLDFDGVAGEDCSICIGVGTPLIAVGVGACDIYVGEECNLAADLGLPAFCDPDAALCEKVGESQDFSIGVGIAPGDVSNTACSTETVKVFCITAAGKVERFVEGVTQCNALPFCDAGGNAIAELPDGSEEQYYDVGCLDAPIDIVLEGNSRDPDGDTLNYDWELIGCGSPGGMTIVELIDDFGDRPNLLAPGGIAQSCEVRLIVTDDVFASTECRSRIIVSSSIAPIAISEPASAVNVECDGAGNSEELNAWLSSNGGAESENLGLQQLFWSSDFSGLSSSGCGLEQSADVTFTAFVCSEENFNPMTQAIFRTRDKTPPSFFSSGGVCPANATVCCGDSTAPSDTGTALASDVCSSGVVTPSFSDVGDAVSCPAGGTITRIWNATDECGNSVTDTFCETNGLPCSSRSDCKRFCSGGILDGILCDFNGIAIFESLCETPKVCSISGTLCSSDINCSTATCDGGTADGLVCSNPLDCLLGTCVPETCEPAQGGTCVRDLCQVKPEIACNQTITVLPSTGSTTCGLGECLHTIDNCVGGAVQVCDPLEGSSSETCDGLDNDCDGAVDEDLGTTTCGLGECNHTVDTCFGGVAQVCDPLEGSSTEVCDGVDNDCDGLVDEDFISTETNCGVGACASTGSTSCVVGSVEDSCTAGAPASDDATCDGVDDDCDGTDDEDYASTATSCGVGACTAMGSTSCVAGSMQDSCTPGLPVVELCDGLDNDCDGVTDEELGTATCGLGECDHTIDNCVGGVSQVCDPLEGASAESCDGLDNDCDGATDEDLGTTTCGLGECDHTIDNCVGGVTQICDPLAGAAPEVCDGVDNNCDGITDEGFIDVIAATHFVGSGSHPGSTKVPLVGIVVCAYDKSDGSCSRLTCGGISHQHYQCIVDLCGEDDGEEIFCCTTDEFGECMIEAPPGDYIVISDDATKTVLPDPLGVSASDLLCGEIKQKHLQQIVKANGKIVPGKTIRRTGSELLIIEPEFVVWDNTEQLYPFIFETVGDWDVTAMVTPPEGFVSDSIELSAQIDNDLETVQFTITEIGSDLVPTGTTFEVTHRGRREVIHSQVGIFLTPKYARSRGFNVAQLRAAGLIKERPGNSGRGKEHRRRK